MSGQDKPVKPVVHLGSLAREIREGHMTRTQFAEQVNISLVDLRRWESGRLLLSTPQLQRIMRHPIMRDLQRRAVEAGIVPTVRPGPGDKDPNQKAQDPNLGGPQDRDIENQGGPQGRDTGNQGDPNDGDGDGGSGT